jgi:hypothetical protein
VTALARRAAAEPIAYYQRSRRVPLPAGANAKFVGRPSRWGNPWEIRSELVVPIHQRGPLPEPATVRVDAELAVALYRTWLLQRPHADLEAALRTDLFGFNLCCWCLPEPGTGWPAACHSLPLRDLLLELT